MSKFTYILDAGHGTRTPGKRSPKFPDGSVLMEGVNNRDIVERLKLAFKDNDVDFFDCVASDDDISLKTRVDRANALAKTKKCVYISIHSDAAGDGSNWHPASGMSIYTSKGQTKSDEFAELVINELKAYFKNEVKWRTDNTDGDQDKEENFYVLKETNCPAVLCELGFHTNLEEATKMLTVDFKNKVILAFVQAIKKFELKN